MERCEMCCKENLDSKMLITHILGKLHRKKAYRFLNDKSIQPCRRVITGLPNFLKVNLHIVEMLLPHKMIDIHVCKTQVFVVFRTKEEALMFSKEKLQFNNIKLNISPDKRESWFQQKNDTAKYEIQLSPHIKEAISSERRSYSALSNDIRLLVNDIELKQWDYQKREHVRQNLENVLNQKFNSVSVYVFGSSTNDLGFRGCDLDLYIDFPPLIWNEDEDAAQERKLINIIARLIKFNRIGYNILKISKARVPIVKYRDQHYGINVDVSFKNLLPIHNSMLLKFYTHLHPLVRPYMMLIRFWAQVQDITGGGQPNTLLKNYCLSLMAIFWLMLRNDPLVPCVGELQENLDSSRSVVVNGWQCGFRTNVERWRYQEHKESILDLAREFFNFFGSLDTNEWMISPLSGTLVSKRDLINKKINAEIPPYLEDLFIQGIKINAEAPFCVQDPFNQSHNISGAFNISYLLKFQAKCRKAKSICDEILNSKASLALLLEPILLCEPLLDEGRVSDLVEMKVIDEVYLEESNSKQKTGSSCGNLSEEKSLVHMTLGQSVPESVTESSSDVVVLNGTSSIQKKSITMLKAAKKDTPKEAVEIISLDDDVLVTGSVLTAETKETPNNALDIVSVTDDDMSNISEVNDVAEIYSSKAVEVISVDDDVTTNTSVVTAFVTNDDPSKAVELIVLDDDVSSKLVEDNVTTPQGSSSVVLAPSLSIFPLPVLPDHSRFSFSFNLHKDKFFKISPDGSVIFKEGETEQSVSNDACVLEFFSFILKSILKCKVDAEEDLPLSPGHLKRKNEFDDLVTTKYTKKEIGKSGSGILASYNCQVSSNVWLGRSKLSKALVKKFMSPLQVELNISNMLIENKTLDSIYFETTLFRRKNSSSEFLVDSKYKTPSKSQKNDINNFFACFASVTKRLASIFI